MPKTTIKIKTFMCPTGLGNPNASCRFHRASDNMTPDGKCPTCKLDLVKSTNPLDKITMTVMGEEDIEQEIEQAKKGERKDIDVSTLAKENVHREKRKQNIKEAIEKARLLEDK